MKCWYCWKKLIYLKSSPDSKPHQDILKLPCGHVFHETCVQDKKPCVKCQTLQEHLLQFSVFLKEQSSFQRLLPQLKIILSLYKTYGFRYERRKQFQLANRSYQLGIQCIQHTLTYGIRYTCYETEQLWELNAKFEKLLKRRPDQCVESKDVWTP